MRWLIVLAALIGIVVVGGGAASVRTTEAATQGRWVIRDLGPCGPRCDNGVAGGLGEGLPLAINEKGEVVGSSNQRAFLWRKGKLRSLGTLGGSGSESHANAINERGSVVGWADTTTHFGPRHAFLWQNGKMRDLGVLPGHEESVAIAINARGQIVGTSCSGGDNPCRAFLWEDGRMRDLGMLPGSSDSGASAINNKGWIIGESIHDGAEAVVWRSGAITGLGKFGGGVSFATDINERGQVVGDFDDGLFLWENEQSRVISNKGFLSAFIDDRGRVTASTFEDRVFRWEQGKLRPVGAGYARAVNERGQIVGVTKFYDGTPVLWQNGKRIKLPLLIGHKFGEADALNERNQIVGYSGPYRSADSDVLLRGRIVLWTFKR